MVIFWTIHTNKLIIQYYHPIPWYYITLFLKGNHHLVVVKQCHRTQHKVFGVTVKSLINWYVTRRLTVYCFSCFIWPLTHIISTRFPAWPAKAVALLRARAAVPMSLKLQSSKTLPFCMRTDTMVKMLDIKIVLFCCLLPRKKKKKEKKTIYCGIINSLCMSVVTPEKQLGVY